MRKVAHLNIYFMSVGLLMHEPKSFSGLVKLTSRCQRHPETQISKFRITTRPDPTGGIVRVI